jgi:hypothetical protein
MRITSVVVAVLAFAVTLPALAEITPTGPARVASLRCVQFAMVREHRHNPNGWPTDCSAQLQLQPQPQPQPQPQSQSKKG